MRIDACFDSHVHWQASGEFSERLSLDQLKGPHEIQQLTPARSHFRGDWLLGFGWDETGWNEKPHRKYLDAHFPDIPVALQRCDAHALWLNTEAMKRAGFLSESALATSGGRLERDASGELTGVVVDQACEVVQSLIPRVSAFEIRRFLLKGVQLFNEAGFTHIRDMTCNESQWNEASRLDQSGLLTLAVEEYFWLKDPNELGQVLSLYERALRESSANLRAKGLKVFYDGALGSEGALLSNCYHGRDHCGLKLWDAEPFVEVLTASWKKRAAVAVHVIGDQAVAEVVDLALSLKAKGVEGELHLEHGELIRGETIQKMKELNVFCHMQPSHWLGDQRWLKEKIGSLFENAFPWRKLQEAGIPFDFGSDAPIDAPDVSRTFRALRESAEAGIPRLLGAPQNHMSHADLAWAPNSFTLFEDERPKQVVFRGQHLL